jgi:hypothetical protein
LLIKLQLLFTSYIAHEEPDGTSDSKQDSDIEDDLSGHKDGADLGADDESDAGKAVVEVEGWRLSSDNKDDGQSQGRLRSIGVEDQVEDNGEGTLLSIKPINGNDTQTRSHREGVSAVLVRSVEESVGIGAISINRAAAQTNRDTPEHSKSPSSHDPLLLKMISFSDPWCSHFATHGCCNLPHPTEAEDDGGLLRGAQMSLYGRKWKLCNMHDISACLCGKSVALSVQNERGNVVCCRIAGCETKWVSKYVLGTSTLIQTIPVSPCMCWAFILA